MVTPRSRKKRTFSREEYTFRGYNYKKSDTKRMAEKQYRPGHPAIAHGRQYKYRIIKEKNEKGKTVYSLYIRPR